MKILAVGGGSGGHVTPVVAVLREVKSKYPKTEIRFWCDKKFAKQANEIMHNFDKSIPVQTIFAGKFRRYHHVSALRQLFWPSLVFHNIKDLFLVYLGLLQSIFKLLMWRPDVVFTKGGYVCLPVGIAAHFLKIPLVIHDSDAYPGLTNRVLSKWAKKIATGAPLEYYPYPKEKSRYVGIPITNEFHKFNSQEQKAARAKWGIDQAKPLITITGGGLGASRINDAVAFNLDKLLKFGSVVLVSGNLQYDELRSITPPNGNNFQLHSFVANDMALLLGAADIVVARAGATTILELAALEKTTILVPNAKLSGGHQLKNAEIYEKAGAVAVIDEEEMVKDPQILVTSINEILSNPKLANKMAGQLSKYARPNAAADVAEMIISNAK